MTTTTTTTTNPEWFHKGHLRDDLAKQYEPLLSSSSSCSNAVYMQTRKKPRLGMRTITSIQAQPAQPKHHPCPPWFLMSGVVTWVGEETSLEALLGSNSLFWGVVSGRNAGGGNRKKEASLEDQRQFLLDFLGAIHGQRMKSISRISIQNPVDATTNTTNSGTSGPLWPIPNDLTVEITYRFDDTMYYPWKVEAMRVVQEDEMEYFSFLLYEHFEGCSCDRCLLGVAIE